MRVCVEERIGEKAANVSATNEFCSVQAGCFSFAAARVAKFVCLRLCDFERAAGNGIAFVLI